MRFLTFSGILVSGTATGVPVDPCERLCAIVPECAGNPHRSFTSGGSCYRFLYKPNGDFCYHTPETAAECPAGGQPVLIADVDELIARREGHGAAAPHPVAPQAPIDPNGPIIEAIAGLPSSYSNFDPVSGDEMVSRAVVTVLSQMVNEGFAMTLAEKWARAKGDDVLRLARCNLRRPLLMRPLLILVGAVCLDDFANCPAREWIEANEDAISAHISHYHKTHWNNRPMTPDNRLMAARITGYLALLSNAVPQLFSTARLKQIGLEQKIYSYMIGEGDAQAIYPQVTRENAFIESIVYLNGPAKNLRAGTPKIFNFMNEDGRGAGPIRDWFSYVAKQMMDPARNLFKVSVAGGRQHMCVSTEGRNIENHKTLYRAIGRFFGLTVSTGHHVGVNFPIMFYSYLLEREVTVDDIEPYEPLLVKTWKGFINTMTADEELSEYSETINGEAFQYTLENRSDLQARKANAIILEGVEDLMHEIRTGFHDVVPLGMLENLTPEDLEQIIIGNPIIDVDDFVQHVVVAGGYTNQSPQFIWLVGLLRDFRNEQRRDFLRFFTGNTHLPIEGFKGLHQPVTIVRSDDPTSNWPTAATCFYQLKVPAYETEEILRARFIGMLNQADSAMGLA